MQLPVEVVAVAQARAADRGREACAARGHGARVEGAIVRGGAATGAAVERVPVQGREDDGSRGANTGVYAQASSLFHRLKGRRELGVTGCSSVPYLVT